MSFPRKEEFIEFEQLARRQHRIFPDACDYGLLIEEFDVDRMRANLVSMMEVFRNPVYNYKAEQWHTGKSIEFEIPIEEDDGQVFGYHFKLSSHDVGITRPMFITIDIKHGVLKYNGC